MLRKKKARTKEKNTLNYVTTLKKFGLKPNLRYPWAVVSNSSRVQGWKLHLSTIPSEADRVLELICPFLCKRKISFKVVQSEFLLGMLNEGGLGDTQVGKFMTIYPQSDTESKEIADYLVRVTKGFHGPVIITDLRLGDIVYTRYGGFNPVITWNRLGQHFFSIYTPAGGLQLDSYDIPFIPPVDIPNPFNHLLLPSNTNKITNLEPLKKLFGPGYLFLETIKGHPRGSVFLGLDLRSMDQVSAKVIKQGRQYVATDIHNRDIRTRLQHQEVLHRKLAELISIPKTDSYFEEGGHGYLPLEYIEGKSIEEIVSAQLNNRPWTSLNHNNQKMLLNYLKKAVTEVQKLHAHGYIHRDLTVSNIWIGKDEKVYLLDLELAHAINDPTPPFALGTMGFMSPNQMTKQSPQFEDDIYSLGSVMIYMLTGLDPRYILLRNEKNLTDKLNIITRGAPKELIELIVNCVKENPLDRPSLNMIKTVLQKYSTIGNQHFLITDKQVNIIQNEKLLSDKIKDLIKRGQQGLLKEVVVDQPSGLWLSAKINEKMDTLNDGSYEVYRDANKGVAGVIYMLGRLARFGYVNNEVSDRVQQIIPWLIVEDERKLPGLHFGNAGIAVALVEAISGGLIQRNSKISAFIENALAGRLDWPDITHGAAGQGIAVLYCSDYLQNKNLLKLAHRCADYLINTQKKDGSWVMPHGVDGMSGETLTGFAHGVSGMIYFLAEYDRRFDCKHARQAWKAGVNWLIDQAIPTKNGEALEWDYSDKNKIRWKWWCHGSPGIALTFLRLYEQTQESIFAEIASKSLRIHEADIIHSNLSQCHGLSGLGEIYLEASRVLGDIHWKERAEKIAKTLISLRRESKRGDLTWLVEDPHAFTADLMVGSSSVVHFLLRFSLQGDKMGFPLLLDPIRK